MGLPTSRTSLGFDLQAQGTRAGLFVASALALALGYLACRFIVTSRLGRVAVAIRDAESRTRFIGYRVDRVKVAIFSFSAMLAGVAGALYVPQVGIINPGEFSPLNSIELVIWVAVGGRATLYGAVVGALLVNYGKTTFTGPLPEAWLFALGGLFVLVTLFLPRGIRRAPGLAEGSLMGGQVERWQYLNPGKTLAETLNISHKTLLYVEGVTVSFDGFRALNDLSFYVDVGELRCVIGPNGAGKTTMMDVVTGKTRPDSGYCFFGQQIDLLELDEPRIAQAGIGRKFQKPTVFEQHSVFENLELAMAGDKRVWPTLLARLSGEQRDRIDEVLGIIGLREQEGRPAWALSHGQKQWLEIGMLLMQDPLLLLVDEPVAGMTHQEMERTAELLLSLEGKHSVVVVEHDMDFVRSIAKRVTVLHQGSVLAEGSMDEVQNDPRVVEVYLGE